MMSDEGRALVADYGVTFVIDHTQFTTNKIAGPARWTAPEFLEVDVDTDSPYGKRADVFAFAMTMLEVRWLVSSDLRVIHVAQHRSSR